MYNCFEKKFVYWEKEREREAGRERQRGQFVVPLTCKFIGWFLCVPWPGIEPATLAYWDDAVNNWITWPGQCIIFDRVTKAWELNTLQLKVLCKLYNVCVHIYTLGVISGSAHLVAGDNVCCYNYLTDFINK